MGNIFKKGLYFVFLVFVGILILSLPENAKGNKIKNKNKDTPKKTLSDVTQEFFEKQGKPFIDGLSRVGSRIIQNIEIELKAQSKKIEKIGEAIFKIGKMPFQIISVTFKKIIGIVPASSPKIKRYIGETLDFFEGGVNQKRKK